MPERTDAAFSLSFTASLALAWILTALLPAAWVVLAINLVQTRDEVIHGLRALPFEYQADLSNQLSVELVTGAVEVVVLTLILQPWRPRPLWRWALVALVLFLPWSLLAFAIGMHAGPISSTHTEWRLILVAALATTALVSGIRALVRRLSNG